MSTDNPRSSFRKIILFPLLTALVALGVLNFLSLREIKREITQNGKDNHDLLVTSQRAYIMGADTIIQTAPDGSQTQLLAKWENAGSTPANPVILEIQCPIIVEKKEEIAPQQMQTQEGHQLQSPSQPVTKLKAVFAPHEVKTGGACIFTKTQLGILLSSHPHFYLTARAIYRDAFSGSPLHITQYCSDTTATKGPDDKIIFQTNLCDKFNCTDDQCPAEERQEIEKEYGKL